VEEVGSKDPRTARRHRLVRTEIEDPKRGLSVRAYFEDVIAI
jgi:hypothetical protein